jgi:hypothetical protein
MKSRKKFLSALAGLSLLGIPLGSMAGVQFSLPSTRVEPSWQSSRQHSPMIFAQEDNQYEWHHHHHHHDVDPNDYNWGGPNRYQYAPGWFSSPPSGWAMDRRRAYLEQRRQVAINMQQQMLARGDTKAAQRLGTTIGQLNSQLGYR